MRAIGMKLGMSIITDRKTGVSGMFNEINGSRSVFQSTIEPTLHLELVRLSSRL